MRWLHRLWPRRRVEAEAPAPAPLRTGAEEHIAAAEAAIARQDWPTAIEHCKMAQARLFGANDNPELM